MRLTPEYRLHSNGEYKRFFGKSQHFRLSECSVYRVNNDYGHFRLGVTIKSRGNAVQRNRVKRCVRESFRAFTCAHPELLGEFDYNIVIPASKKMIHPYSTRLVLCLKEELSRALARV